MHLPNIFKTPPTLSIEELPSTIDELHDSIPAHCYSFLFIIFQQTPALLEVGIDRRNGTVCIVPVICDDRYLPAKYISYETMYAILKSNKQLTSDRKFLNLNAHNWEEYCLFKTGDRINIYGYDVSGLGCGMHYGSHTNELWFLVEENQYHLLPEYVEQPRTIPFGFFATKSLEEIENFLLEISSVRPQGIHSLAGKLKDGDIRLSNV